MFDRFAICEAYYWYDIDWGPTPYGARLHRIGYRPGICSSLASADEDVKALYGRLVREHHRLYIGYLRLWRRASHGRRGEARAPSLVPWPGMVNVKDPWDWLKKRGLLNAVESCA